ncbi:MAG TPA: ABC transporter ATP-binding protein [Candidatus Brocadiaceae bacterium]
MIRNISFSVRPKETLMLMGPSGSGKSTLLLTILGIITPKKGKIFLNEEEITHLPIEARNIGYLPQDYGLFPHLNVIENVTYGLYVRGISKKEREDVASKILTLVELQGFEKRRIQGLSGGQKQRVGLARALAIKPSLFLLDEPLSNIDQVTKSDVAKELKNLFYKLNIPIILVTHNHEDALLLSKDIAILIDGKIEQIGIRDEIIKNPKTPFIKKLLLPFTINE